MAKENYQLLNYSTHALESFQETAQAVYRSLGIPVDVENFVAGLILDSVKFILPDNGYLFDEHDYKPSMFELQRLPFDVCALEFCATQELFNPDSGLAYSPKRIALAFDPRKLSPERKAQLTRLLRPGWESAFPERALAIMAVYEANGVWASSVGIVVLDLDNDRPVQLTPELAQQDDLLTSVRPKLGPANTKHGMPVTFYTFGERCRYLGMTDQEATQNLLIDTVDETRTTYEFLAAINCSNVGMETVTASAALNSKRIKNGKRPFFDYKVLDIDVGASGGSRTGSTGLGASVRTHLRRGHIRRLGEKFGNKVLWINATMVNASSTKGVVDKAYRMKKQA